MVLTDTWTDGRQSDPIRVPSGRFVSSFGTLKGITRTSKIYQIAGTVQQVVVKKLYNTAVN